MNKARPFRTRLWLYFILFAAVIFSLLWILQTVFLQNFYNGMLAKNTCAAAEKIVAASADDDFTEVIDRLSAEDSLLVFVTEGDGTILYSSDAYRSYYNSPEHVGDGNSNPYHKGEVLSWQKTAYRNLPDGYDSFLEELQQSPQKRQNIPRTHSMSMAGWSAFQMAARQCSMSAQRWELSVRRHPLSGCSSSG